MIKISLMQDGLTINNVVFVFPIEIQKLKNVLGQWQEHKTKSNHLFIWDELGIKAYSKNGEVAEHLLISLKEQEHKFCPKQVFSGDFLFDNQEILHYRKANPEKLIKLFSGDRNKGFILSGVSVWFDINDGVVEALELGAYKQEELPEPLQIDEAYKYLELLWHAWIEEINKVVPTNNSYYNLTHGISEEDIKNSSRLQEDINIPDELLNFYKIKNVDYDSVASPFSFSTDSYEYTLIPFKNIVSEWEAIQELQDVFDSDELNLDWYSPKVKADDYANPKWIPFAEGNGDYLLFDTDPSEVGSYGQIVELINESWERNVVADSLKELLENEIELHKNGNTEKFDFILDKYVPNENFVHKEEPIEFPKIFNDIRMDSDEDLFLESKNFDTLFEKIVLCTKEETQELEENGWKSNFHTACNDETDLAITAIRDDGLTLSIVNTQMEERKFLGLIKKPLGKQLIIHFMLPNEEIERQLFHDKLSAKFLPDIKEYWSNLLLSAEKGLYYKNVLDETIKPQDIVALTSLPLVREKYNDWNSSDRNGRWFGNRFYSFCMNGFDDMSATLRIGAEITDEDDFDMRFYYFRNDNIQNPSKVLLKYLSSQENRAGDYYSETNLQVCAADWQKYKESLEWYRSAMPKIEKANREFLEEKESNKQESFMEPFKGFDSSCFWKDSEYAREAYIDISPTEALIAEIEAELGYKLPASYIALMKTQNGGIPVDTCFRTEDSLGWAEDHIAVTGLYSIGRDKRYSLCGDIGSTFMLEEWGYPAIGVVIADTPTAGHQVIMLDYRECGPMGEPKVVYVNQEWDYEITVLANTFEAFIRGLINEEVFDTSA